MKKIKLLLLISILTVFVISAFVFIKYKFCKENNKQNNSLVVSVAGIIEDKKITLEEQYLYIKDNNGNKVKINITENTIFKERLKLEEGDKINIKGKYINNSILQAEEISN